VSKINTYLSAIRQCNQVDIAKFTLTLTAVLSSIYLITYGIPYEKRVPPYTWSDGGEDVRYSKHARDMHEESSLHARLHVHLYLRYST
jgi:hypothetical protein